MKEQFITKTFRADTQELIEHMDAICADYMRQHMTLTLRQLYYRLVSKDLIPNTQKSYGRIGRVLSDARLAGLVDWDAIVDRERSLAHWETWANASAYLRSVAYGLRYSHWDTQRVRVEVWVEKKALIAVVSRGCVPTLAPHFACKGYVSQTALRDAAHRAQRHADRNNGQPTVILYLGDHDPSGLDMPRDIGARLALFGVGDIVSIDRIALTIAQIHQHDPPPNPAKVTDSRFASYRRDWGEDSWELDALEPQALSHMIASRIEWLVDMDKVTQAEANQRQDITQLEKMAHRYDESGWPGVFGDVT